MLRHLRSRPLALLAGLWFLVAGREPPFPHPCEMGGTVAAASDTVDAARHATRTAHGAAQDVHAGHGQSRGLGTAAPAHSPHGEMPPECECVDDCCISAALHDACPTSLAAPRLVPQVEAERVPAARALGSAPRLLPFANGPPRLS